jgi:hypothetical protein
MTYKAAVTGLNLGGGKAVIIGDSSIQKNELLFRTFGKFVEGLGGRFIAAETLVLMYSIWNMFAWKHVMLLEFRRHSAVLAIRHQSARTEYL